MTDAIAVEPKKRGRPKGAGRDPLVGLRMSPDLRARVEAWAADNAIPGQLSEAIRRLLDKALS